jgi:porin
MESGGLPVRDAELAVEITYRAQITPWLAIQPDVQRVVHPGTDPGIPDATVCGTRIEVRF